MWQSECCKFFLFIFFRRCRPTLAPTPRGDSHRGSTLHPSPTDPPYPTIHPAIHANPRYGSQTGTAKRYAEKLHKECSGRQVSSDLVDLAEYEPEELVDDGAVCVFVLSTYEGGTPPPSAAWMHKWLDETRNDFRVEKRLLRGLKSVLPCPHNTHLTGR